MNNIYNYNINELEEILLEFAVKRFRVKQIWNWLYKNLVTDFSEMKNLDNNTITLLQEKFYIPNFEVIKHQKAKDGTQKALLKLNDDKLIETVLMKYKHGYSVCVTTQIGCAVGCSFCASGLLGFTRNLTAGEIVAQVIFWQKSLVGNNERVSNVVIMGIGEPFNNYKNTIDFIDKINDKDGLNIGARHITVSTSGIVPKIYELANYDKQISLAISLHAANDKTRSNIMKINDVYPITDLMQAVDEYIEKTNRRVSFEYIMLKDVNDSSVDAHELCKLLKYKNCHVNLIPYNSVEEKSYKSSAQNQLQQFVDILKMNNIQVSVRRSNGDEIDGACGQLRHKEKDNNA